MYVSSFNTVIVLLPFILPAVIPSILFEPLNVTDEPFANPCKGSLTVIVFVPFSVLNGSVINCFLSVPSIVAVTCVALIKLVISKVVSSIRIYAPT